MRAWILGVFLLISPWAAAQSPMDHAVSLRIPPVAYLRPEGARGEAASVLELGAGLHGVRLLANTRWTLSVEVRGEAVLASRPLAEELHLFLGQGSLTLTLWVGGEVRLRVEVGLLTAPQTPGEAFSEQGPLDPPQ
ncbi:hypothetical protein [Thermus scotoductus]|uniref:hypothetical protein n=1 Tax=Thermus scotoductus TaxID=37636 RepID=UPI000F7F494D|nr:hypothetical protein [Thermus scotoductus]